MTRPATVSGASRLARTITRHFPGTSRSLRLSARALADLEPTWGLDDETVRLLVHLADDQPTLISNGPHDLPDIRGIQAGLVQRCFQKIGHLIESRVAYGE